MTDQEKFNKAVMIWISEATSMLQYRNCGGERILADACGQCWTAFEAMKNHDAEPAAKAPVAGMMGKPDSHGTGNTPEPVAYARYDAEGILRNVYTPDEHDGGRIAWEGWGCTFAPLYRSPTLTDEERFVLLEVRDIYADEDDVKCNEIAAVIDGLLERLK